ncbi:hypothetical protein [Planomonospora algeriensis]
MELIDRVARVIASAVASGIIIGTLSTATASASTFDFSPSAKGDGNHGRGFCAAPGTARKQSKHIHLTIHRICHSDGNNWDVQLLH